MKLHDMHVGGVSVTRLSVGNRRTRFAVVNGSSLSAQVTFNCARCRTQLHAGSVPSRATARPWVDWCACSPAPSLDVSVRLWHGDGWDALRGLILEAEC